MARYRVQGPDGQIHVFEGPDGAAPADVEAFAAQQFGSQPAAAPEKRERTGVEKMINLAAKANPVSAIVDELSGGNASIGAARGVKDVIDTGAGFLSRLGGSDEAARIAADNAAGKQDFDATYGDSTAAKLGRVAGQVAATAPVGGAIGTAVKATSAAPVVQAVGNAIASGGMSTGKNLGVMADLAARATGGAIAGGASAGLVDPGSAGVGAAIGAGLPVAVKAGGAVANTLMRTAGKAVPEAGEAAAAAAAQPTQKMATARAGAEAGYVIPPVDLQPGMVSQLLSGLSGKIKTSQVASQRNQLITDDLARRALGLEAGAELTPEVLQAVRSRAGDAYSTIRGAGAVQADQAFLDRLTQIGAVSQGASRSFPGLKQNGVEDMIAAVRQPSFDAGDAVDAIKVLREAADKGFRTGDATAGRAAKAAASALEDQLERHLGGAGNAEAVKAFRDARAQIAKTYSVQGALNPATGSVSAPKLAGDLLKGKPLTGELRQVAEFSQAFPKATQALKEAPGAVSPLDWLFSGGTALGVGGPAGAAMLFGRPAARAALLSGPVQARALQESAASEPLQSLLARALEASARGVPGALAGPVSSR